MLTLNNSVAQTSYAYDTANQLLSETQAVPGQAARTVGYGHDSDGNRRTLSYPGGTVITNTFTARSQLATITANGPAPLASYTYDAAGRRVSKTVENGTSTTYGYDDANRLLGLAQWRGTNQFAALAYTYNTVGNLIVRTNGSLSLPFATIRTIRGR